MAQMLPLQAPTLAHAALPAVSGPRAALLRNIALAVAGSLLLVLAAKIKVPFWPVPMTLQTLVVFGVGAAFGPRLGAATAPPLIGVTPLRGRRRPFAAPRCRASSAGSSAPRS